MLNKVMIIGRLGRDPELRYTQNGTPVTSLNVATDESYLDRDGVRQERTEWHRVTVFQKQAELCSNYLSKGSLVYVEGSLQTRKWTDQQGVERYTTEIKAQRVQFLDRRSANNDGGHGGEGGYGRNNYGYNGGSEGGYGRNQGQSSWDGGQQGHGGHQEYGGRAMPQNDYAPRQAPQQDYAPRPAAPAAQPVQPVPQPQPVQPMSSNTAPQPSQANKDEDLGSPFPSEASLDEVPF